MRVMNDVDAISKKANSTFKSSSQVAFTAVRQAHTEWLSFR